MNKDAIFSLLRHALSAIGAYLVGRTLFGSSITSPVIEVITGSLMTAAGVVWSILDKSVTIEAVQGAIRQITSAIGGLVAASGKISATTVAEISGVLVMVVPYIQSWISRSKSKKISEGQIAVGELKK